MDCCGKHIERRPEHAKPEGGFKVLPYEPCVFCAEKHISRAWRLASECGYAFPNRQTIIGELENAEEHLFENWRPLFVKVRMVRHLVQLRQESKIDWNPLLAEIDALASAEAAKLKENGHVPH